MNKKYSYRCYSKINKSGSFKAALAGLTVLSGILFVPACSESVKESAPDPYPELAEALDSLFLTIFPDENAPGGTVMVMSGDDIVYSRGFGLATLDGKLHNSDSVQYNTASCTKCFVTMGLLKIVEQGYLSLETPVSKFFPDFPSEIFDKITIRHILTHTTGLPDLRPRDKQQWEEYIKHNPDTPFSAIRDYIRYGREEELSSFYCYIDTVISEPGEVFYYQDVPFMLVGRIIQEVTGSDFREWMAKNIFEEAGLHETEFFRSDRRPPNRAHGYRPTSGATPRGVFRSEDGRWEEYDYGEAPFFYTYADKGIYSTPRDYMKWLQYISEGNVISKEFLDSAYTVQVQTPVDNIGYALGVFVRNDSIFPPKIFRTATNGGYSIFEGRYPSNGLYYLIFSNRPDWNRRDIAAKTDSILVAQGWLKPVAQ